MSLSEKNCNNCNSSIKEDDLFCHHCGQKYRRGKPTLWMILGEFASSLFNIDSKAYQSLIGIFKPGKLTNAFIDGRLKSFTPPIRVFIVSSVFLVAVLSASNNTIEERNENDLYIYEMHRSAVMEEIKEFKPNLAELFDDSVSLAVVDTIINKFDGGDEFPKLVELINSDEDDDPWSFDTSREVPVIDIFRLSEDSLFQKYDIKGYFYKRFARQQIKNHKDGDSLAQFLISRITIQALVMMPIVALILKLLYWRREQYFVDHFVFSLHYHSFVFLLLGLSFLLCFLFDLDIVILLPALLLILLYLFLAMKQVYKQSVGKTILKFLLLNLIYLFVITGFGVFAILFSFLTF